MSGVARVDQLPGHQESKFLESKTQLTQLQL